MQLRVYSAIAPEVAITAVEDLLELRPASNVHLTILSAYVGQSSDAADAEAEMLRIRLMRRTTNNTSTAVSEIVHVPGMPAADTQAFRNSTVEGTGGDVLIEEAFNVQAGWYYQPVPEERILVAGGGDNLVINLVDAPADSLDLMARITWGEIG